MEHKGITIKECVDLASSVGVIVNSSTAQSMLGYICDHKKERAFRFIIREDGKVRVEEVTNATTVK